MGVTGGGGQVGTLTFAPRMGEASLRREEARERNQIRFQGHLVPATDTDWTAGPVGEAEREIVRETETEMERDRERDSDRERDEGRQTERERETVRHRERPRGREGDRNANRPRVRAAGRRRGVDPTLRALEPPPAPETRGSKASEPAHLAPLQPRSLLLPRESGPPPHAGARPRPTPP